MKKRLYFLCMFLVILLDTSFSLEETIILGTDDGWGGAILNNTLFLEGREGYTDIRLADSEYTLTADTDLLLHFNSIHELGVLTHYSLEKNDMGISTVMPFLGTGAGVFQHQKEALVLKGKRNALFSPGISWKDFSIEFWMYPATLEDGETIILWQGSRITGQEITHQEVRVHTEGQRVNWRFDNFFLYPDMSDSRIELKGLSILIPRRWAHHLLRFDSSTGLLEYLVNGRPEGVTYVSASGHEDSTVYLPKTGDSAEYMLTIGSHFTGFLDELRISSRFVEDPSLHKLGKDKGMFVTRTLDLGYTNTRVVRIRATDAVPADSAIYYYYRTSNSLSDLHFDRAAWIPFRSDIELGDEARGKYLQIRGELYPDGTQRVSPVLSSLAIYYDPDLPPLPPTGLTGAGGNSSIHLDWDSVPDEDIKGYLLYYGDSPGVYFGRDALEGVSPVDTGNVTSFVLTGLENGKLYYFTLVSYDDSDPPHYSETGLQISVRPGVHGDGR